MNNEPTRKEILEKLIEEAIELNVSGNAIGCLELLKIIRFHIEKLEGEE